LTRKRLTVRHHRVIITTTKEGTMNEYDDLYFEPVMYGFDPDYDPVPDDLDNL